jgi:hypothetical protein
LQLSPATAISALRKEPPPSLIRRTDISGRIIIPGITETPRGVAILADKLGEAIGILESWKLRVSPASRLQAAKRLLHHIATTPAYPEDEAQLHRIGNAIRIAFDFYHITRCLTEDRVNAISEDLRRSLDGTLNDYGPTEANRAQSQVLIAAVMAAGGLKPGAPVPGQGQTPDYVVNVDSLRFGVEIKRPESQDRVLKHVDKAIDQINALGTEGGVIVIDLSDCLLTAGERTWLVHDDVRPAFRDVYTVVSDHIASSERSGADIISNLFIFTNLFAWRRVSPPVPAPLFLMYSEVFRDARTGLIVEYSRRLRDQIDRGYEAFEGEIIQRKQVDSR